MVAPGVFLNIYLYYFLELKYLGSAYKPLESANNIVAFYFGKSYDSFFCRHLIFLAGPVSWLEGEFMLSDSYYEYLCDHPEISGFREYAILFQPELLTDPFLLEDWKATEAQEKFINIRRRATFFEETDAADFDKFYSLQQWRHSFSLEIFWAVAPTIIIVTILGPSLILLYSSAAIKYSDYNINLNAHQWFWNVFSSTGGCSTIHDVMVPVKFENSFANFFNGGSFFMDHFWKKISFMEPPFYYFLDLDTFKGNPSFFFDHFDNFDSYLLDIADEAERGYTIRRLLDTTQHVKAPSSAAIKFSVTANDVLHSFALPSISAKVDAVVGRVNELTVFLAKEGVLRGQCSELCGAGHYGMPLVLEVLNVFDFFSAVEADFWEAATDSVTYCPFQNQIFDFENDLDLDIDFLTNLFEHNLIDDLNIGIFN